MSSSGLLSLTCLFMAIVQGRAGWPNIEPFNIRVPVNLASEKVVIDVPIKNPTGRVLYHFACRGGAEAYLNSLPGNWVGPLMCILAEGDKPTEESLLSEDDSAAWFSRGQFRREELVGDCAKYPEFGVHRSFRLRGFRLTLDVQDVMADERGSRSRSSWRYRYSEILLRKQRGRSDQGFS